MTVPLAGGSSTSFTPDRLIAQPSPMVTRQVTILTANTIVRGEVLGKITASGKYIRSLSAAVDGSEVPDLIAAEAIDASGADAVGMCYATGIFNEDALTIGTAHTVATILEGLRVKGIHLQPPVGA